MSEPFKTPLTSVHEVKPKFCSITGAELSPDEWIKIQDSKGSTLISFYQIKGFRDDQKLVDELIRRVNLFDDLVRCVENMRATLRNDLSKADSKFITELLAKARDERTAMASGD